MPKSGAAVFPNGFKSPGSRRICNNLQVNAMDTDLDSMSREQLVAEVRKLRKGIREHRDSRARTLLASSEPWALLPERSDPVPVVPVAAIHGRLHPISAVSRRAGAERSPNKETMTRMMPSNVLERSTR